MAKASNVERDKRILQVQGWIVEGVQASLIIRQIIASGWCKPRQAQRYLTKARKAWIEAPTMELEEKRKLKVVELQQLKRSMKEPWKGTPAGIMAIMAIERQIIELEGLKPAQEHLVKGDKNAPIAHDHKGAVTVRVVHTGVPFASSEEEVKM